MKRLGFCAVLLLGTLTAWAGELDVRLTVSEPAGVARTGELATGGVPFIKGQVKDIAELGLFDAKDKPVPVQFSRLAGYEDGSVQWVLVDLLVDLPAKGRAEYRVRVGKRVPPRATLKITESKKTVVVDTGAAVFTVNRTALNLLESVQVAGRRVAGPGALKVVEAGGEEFSAAKPGRVSWEYRGPLRATLRVDGPYLGEGGKKFIDYTVRFTFCAGSGLVRVDHSLRNSNPKQGGDVKISEAMLELNLAAGEGNGGSGETWKAVEGEKVGVLIAARHTGGCFPGGGVNRKGRKHQHLFKLAVGGGRATVWAVPEEAGLRTGRKGYAGFMGKGHFALADCAHKDTRLWLDFAAGGRGAKNSEARFRALRSPLHAMVDGAWVSETGALGVGRFGTLVDEIATYKRWGLKGAEDPARMARAKFPHTPDLYLPKLWVHEESECDSVELGCLMYLRTGARGWLDIAQAYAGYFRTHYFFRTDGFAYDGFRNTSDRISKLSKRPCSGRRFGWHWPPVYGWPDSRLCACHTWGAGLFDYYCLTGDVDSLEAGLDIAEHALVAYANQKPGKYLFVNRNWGRQLLVLLRAWQLTGDAKWKRAADTYIKCALKAPNRRRGGALVCTGDRTISKCFKKTRLGDAPPAALLEYMNRNGITMKAEGNTVTLHRNGESWNAWALPLFPLGSSSCHEAFYRYYVLTGDEAVGKLVVGMAALERDYRWSTKCEHAIQYALVGIPEKGKVYDPGRWWPNHKGCPNKGGVHNGYHDRFLADTFARAYAVDRDPAWLGWAKRVWNRGSKWGYMKTSQGTPDGEVFRFAGFKPPQAASESIRNSYVMFYHVPRAEKLAGRR